MTKSELSALPLGTWLRNIRSPRLRARINGKMQTWKTRPGAFSLPMKYGLRVCFRITELDSFDWELDQ